MTVYDDCVVQERWNRPTKKYTVTQEFSEIVAVKPLYDSEYVPGTFLELVRKQPEPITKAFPYRVPYIIPYGIKAQKDAAILMQQLAAAIDNYHKIDEDM